MLCLLKPACSATCWGRELQRHFWNQAALATECAHVLKASCLLHASFLGKWHSVGHCNPCLDWVRKHGVTWSPHSAFNIVFYLQSQAYNPLKCVCSRVRMETRGQYCVSSFIALHFILWNRFSRCWIWNSLTQLDRRACESQASSYLCLSGCITSPIFWDGYWESDWGPYVWLTESSS